MENKTTTGLYIVGTPIGNLGDMTLRAAKVLAEADLICVEDTRVSRVLLSHYGISTPITPYHDFNKEKVLPRLMGLLKDGKTVALISDAGMPGIADPAFNLVREALRQDVPVSVVPGPSALITALVGSGLPTDRFIFENFLPPKSARRRKVLEGLKAEPRTVIFYETPHRIVSVLRDMDETIPETLVVIGRELTKVFEEFLRGTPKTLLAHFERARPRGEMVVMFNTRINKL